MNNSLVIYHGGCRDGFCSAWIVDKFLKTIPEIDNNNHQITRDQLTDYFPDYYGQEPPDVRNKHVIMVDFSYDVDTMWRMCKEALSFTWFDHHKTAIPVAELFHSQGSAIADLDFCFDVSRSGAGLAWDRLFPGDARPWIVDYVEDRDLWSKKLNNTDVVNAYIACLEFDFQVWDEASDLDVEDVAEYGQTAVMKTEQYVREVCKNVYSVNSYPNKDETGYRLILGDFEHLSKIPSSIPVVNICQVDCSEVLHELCKMFPEAPFSLYWFKRADGLYQYGLRSIGDFDVSIVAKLFGGGGHKNAAGFQLDYLLEELK